MRRGLVIDAHGRAWPASRPEAAAAGLSDMPSTSSARGLGVLYIGLIRSGAEIVLRGDTVPAPALMKALHILATWWPRRVALTHPRQSESRVELFSGVWELAAYAETLARGWPAPGPAWAMSDAAAALPRPT